MKGKINNSDIRPQFNYLQVNSALSHKKVVVFPVNINKLVPDRSPTDKQLTANKTDNMDIFNTSKYVKKRVNKTITHPLYSTNILFNKFANKLKTEITEAELNSKLESTETCYLFVNNNEPSAFINGKLVALKGIKLNEKYLLSKVILEVIQALRDLKKSDKNISLRLKSVVFYESMIDNGEQVPVPEYEMPVSEYTYNIARKLSESKKASSGHYESAYGHRTSDHPYIEIKPSSIKSSNSAYSSTYASRPDSPPTVHKSSLKRAKSKRAQ